MRRRSTCPCARVALPSKGFGLLNKLQLCHFLLKTYHLSKERNFASSPVKVQFLFSGFKLNVRYIYIYEDK